MRSAVLVVLVVLLQARIQALDGLNLPREESLHEGKRVLTWDFGRVQRLYGIEQAIGTGDFVLAEAATDYEWQTSSDGRNWQSVARVEGERRFIRRHLFQAESKAVRLITSPASGTNFRSLKFLTESNPASRWVLIVNSTHDPKVPNHGQEFLPLVRSVPGWEDTPAQQVWVGDCDPALVRVDPPPVAVFFSGSFKDWCEVPPESWRGVEQILQEEKLPIWASCGGAQALAILTESGTQQRWDCPHCRDPQNPKTPIYGHIGHTGKAPCGDYSKCTFERGPHQVKKIKNDRVFQALPEVFTVMQSHCGQIEWAPEGWELIAVGGPGSKTRVQCIKRKDGPIYAAQFHIEMEGTPETSRVIMANFLKMAAESQGLGANATERDKAAASAQD